MDNKTIGFLIGALLIGAAMGFAFAGTTQQGDYLEKSFAPPNCPETNCPPVQSMDECKECNPSEPKTIVNLRFDEYEENNDLETRECNANTRWCDTNKDNTKYYGWGYLGVNYRGGAMEVVDTPDFASSSIYVDGDILDIENNVLFYSAKYLDRTDAPDGVDEQGGNRVINYFGQSMTDGEIEFDFMIPEEYENEDADSYTCKGPYNTETERDTCIQDVCEKECGNSIDLTCITDCQYREFWAGITPHHTIILFGENWDAFEWNSLDDSNENNWANGVYLAISGRSAMTPNTIFSTTGQITKYDYDKWYHAKITIDSENEEYTISINGQSTQSLPINVNPHHAGIDEINQMVVGARGSDQENDMNIYLDNIVVRSTCYQQE